MNARIILLLVVGFQTYLFINPIEPPTDMIRLGG